MRDIKRIDNFTNELNRVWKTHFPDLRFGQLMSNFLGWIASEKERDIFFPEEDKMLEFLYEFCGEKDGKCIISKM